jgi:hypothetical protein
MVKNKLIKFGFHGTFCDIKLKNLVHNYHIHICLLLWDENSSENERFVILSQNFSA